MYFRKLTTPKFLLFKMERNRLIIIGNGFDIAHGLKTKYSDFIEWLLCHSYKSYIDGGHYFEDLGFRFGNKEGGSSYFLDQRMGVTGSRIFELITSYTDCFLIKGKFIKQLVNIVHKEKRWVDIESSYFQTLLSFFKGSTQMAGLGNTQLENIKKRVVELNGELEYLGQKLEEYLLTINKAIDPKRFEKNPQSNISNILAPNKKNKIMYLNFNYTDTLLIKKYGNDDDVNFIHGRLGAKENPIVFGYGDENTKEIQELEHMRVNEYLRKLKSFAYLRAPNYKKLLTFIDAQKFDVYIVGHSCGITDRALLKEIFEHPNCDNIRVFFYERENGSDSFEDTALEISRHFTDKQLMRRKMINKDAMDLIPQFR